MEQQDREQKAEHPMEQWMGQGEDNRTVGQATGQKAEQLIGQGKGGQWH